MADLSGSKRQKVKELIRRLESEDKGIEQNIFKSVENVSLGSIIEYKDKDGGRHRFTDDITISLPMDVLRGRARR